MPRAKANDAAAGKPVEPEKPTSPERPEDPEEQVDLDDPEEEEEVEYEEVEEEVTEDEEEPEEEEVEEEEVEEEAAEDTNGADAQQGVSIDQEMKDCKDEDESKKHAELLALPPHGSEVYIGNIPHDASEEDLKNFCESVGEVTEIRRMKAKESGENRGFAFVTFRTKDLATKAIKDLNNSVFKGKKIKSSSSQAKHRLFIGNIPRSWGEEDLRKVVTEVGPGVNVVELRKDPHNSSRNRCFAFIEYYNHACAEYSREKMSKPTFKLEKNAPTVSWADPKNADSSAPSQVKAVYVKNLPKNITQSKLKELFEHHGEITKVVLPPAKSGQERNRIGFVHFADKSSAMNALKDTEKYEIDGQVLECSLAKPQTEWKAASGPTSQKSALYPTYPPRIGYGLIGGAYGGGYGSPGLAQQPLIYGRGPTPAGMAMMPMLLPNGQIGYVLQQPGTHPLTPHPLTPPPQHRNGRSGGGRSGSGGGRGGSGGGRSSGGRHSSSDNGRGRRYHPY